MRCFRQIRVDAVGVCGSDLAYWAHGVAGGTFPIPFPASLHEGYRGVMGHEAAGTVQRVGAGVTSLHPGDRVALEPGVPCGACRQCRSGQYNLCPTVSFIGSFVNRVPGALAQLFNHDANFCYKVACLQLGAARVAWPRVPRLHARNMPCKRCRTRAGAHAHWGVCSSTVA